MVAAPATGQGKTTIATGLMAALTRAGHVVSGHKVGPDYIDPGYHALASGRPGRNLDPHLVGEARIVPLLLHGAAGADIAVVEGVMGLFDGRIGGNGFASTAHVAALTRTPVVLVVDISRSSRSIGAVVHGMATWDPGVQIAGVILNKAGSARHAAEVAGCIDLPVLGTIGRDEAVSAPSRHLGLVPAAERDEAALALDRLAAQVAEAVDLDRLVELAGTAEDLDEQPWDPAAEVAVVSERRPVVAMAGGRAFTFRYAETEELLSAAGCEVVTFDPLTDDRLPERTSGIYLGGGFPEVFASELSANRPLRADLRDAVAAGTPTVAECAGLLYLCRSVDDSPMVGTLDASGVMTPRLTLAYPTLVAASDSVLTRAGEQITGHEFHRTTVSPPAGERPAWSTDGADAGFTSNSLHASYLHTHWAGHPQLAQRFAEAVHAAAPHASRSTQLLHPAPERTVAPMETAPPTETPVERPLLHHGDVEVTGGLLDFAVNVHPGPPPPWLERALRAGLDAAGSYPTTVAAELALAELHGRAPEEVLATAGAAEAFTLLARLRRWRMPVVVHPQFTEPHAALLREGHLVQEVTCAAGRGFALDPETVPEAADLVVVGNPTNPTGVLHPASVLRRLLRPGRVVVVDEAFMDVVPGGSESLADLALPGLVVVRSLTKHWGIPGVRAGYLLAEPETRARLREQQVPWSVSSPAAAAMVACATPEARVDAAERAASLAGWRAVLEQELAERGVAHQPSSASFVLAELGAGAHAELRDAGIAVRRCDTFPGLGPEWVRIAVRPPAPTRLLLAAIDDLRTHRRTHEALTANML